jgi:hypothetical protein
MKTGKLNGKIAVITGGSSGIGLATAERFVKEGAYVFITGRRQAELDKAVVEIGSNVTGLQADVSNLDLRSNEGGSALVRAHLDGGVGKQRNPRECDQLRPRRDTYSQTSIWREHGFDEGTVQDDDSDGAHGKA